MALTRDWYFHGEPRGLGENWQSHLIMPAASAPLTPGKDRELLMRKAPAIAKPGSAGFVQTIAGKFSGRCT